MLLSILDTVVIPVLDRESGARTFARITLCLEVNKVMGNKVMGVLIRALIRALWQSSGRK